MPSVVTQILSLTTIILLSLAQPNGFDVAAENFAQPLADPVANLDGLGGLALGLGASGEADVSGKIPDARSAGIAQVVVARPDAHGCSKGRKRRRGDETFCSSTDTKAPPSSQQKNPQNSDGEPSNAETGQQKQPETPESMPVLAPVLEASCPEDHFPICAAPNLLENPLAPGTYTAIPWVGHNVPQIIDIEEYSRFCASI